MRRGVEFDKSGLFSIPIFSLRNSRPFGKLPHRPLDVFSRGNGLFNELSTAVIDVFRLRGQGFPRIQLDTQLSSFFIIAEDF